MQSSPEPLAHKEATSSSRPCAEIWIREVRSRRQAFFRCPSLPQGPSTWQKLFLTTADKALKVGTLDLGAGVVVSAVAATDDGEQAPAHPMREQFAVQAQALNADIDSLNLSAGGAA